MSTAATDRGTALRTAFLETRDVETAWSSYAARRANALDVITRDGLSVRGREDWMHGNPAGLVAAEVLPVHGDVETATERTFAALPASHLLVFVNGTYAAERSRPGNLPAGVTLRALDDGDESELVGSVADDAADAFTALNSAFWRDGLLLDVPAGVELENPVELHFLSDLAGETGLVPVRNVVRVGAGASATVIERSAPGAEGVAEQPLTEVVCGAGARVDHIKLVGGEARGEHHGATHVVQAAGSRYRSWEFATGGALVRRELHLALQAEGATCDLNALYMGGGTQRFDMRTRVRHDAPGCETNELYKGILDGKSRGVFDGQIYVARDSQQTNAFQTNRNLLLSDDAVVNSIPRLEIYADDVKCSHGSTTGQIEDEQMFYLVSRGFSPLEARTWLAWAFASEVVESVPVAALREELSAIVTRSLDVVDPAVIRSAD